MNNPKNKKSNSVRSVGRLSSTAAASTPMSRVGTGTITMSITDRDWMKKTVDAITDLRRTDQWGTKQKVAKLLAARLDITPKVAQARLDYLARLDIDWGAAINADGVPKDDDVASTSSSRMGATNSAP